MDGQAGDGQAGEGEAREGLASDGGNFFARRWQRQVPLGLLVWRDMIVVGSCINLAFAFASLMALGFKAGAAVALAIFLVPMPYNVFLVASVWRTAELVSPSYAHTARLTALAWLAVAAVI